MPPSPRWVPESVAKDVIAQHCSPYDVGDAELDAAAVSGVLVDPDDLRIALDALHLVLAASDPVLVPSVVLARLDAALEGQANA